MQQRGTFAQKASGPKVETEEKIKIRPRSADRAKRRNPLAGTGRRRRFKYTLKRPNKVARELIPDFRPRVTIQRRGSKL